MSLLMHGLSAALSDSGRVRLRIDRFEVPFLLTTSLGTGLGSGEILIDRGQAGKVRLVEFRRVGTRVLLVQRNKHHLATGDAATVRAGAESFASSTIWTAEIEPEPADAVTVDATELVLTDHFGLAAPLADARAGQYAVDRSLSVVLAPSASAAGLRLPATLTLRGPGDSAAVGAVAPNPELLTFDQHLLLLPLPDPPMPARRYHPGAGGYGIRHTDHGRDQPEVGLQPRFRTDRPIVFHVDPAVPEPVRAAVIEGGNWWQDAFARAGRPGMFRVEALPEGTNPHDPGINAVFWVYRDGRGWSYGQGLTDPRTGEILLGRVRLGAQRVAQVTALAEALLAPYGQPDEAARLAAVRDLVAARMRQLAAHEIGHALGFMHNYASTTHQKPSVMDYPFPRVRLTDSGEIDLSAAYEVGLGPWDMFLVAHAYGRFTDSADSAAEDAGAAEEAGLAELRRTTGLAYVTDEDGHADCASHVDGVPWVAGPAALAQLDTALRVREATLRRFSHAVLPPDRQTGELEERATLLYLFHRHAVTAVARLLGGVRYTYALAGDDVTGTQPVDGATQRAALTRLTALLRPEHLALPDTVLTTVSPPAIRYDRSRQYLPTRAGRVFDPLSAVEVGASLVVGQVLEPTRLNRLAWQHAVSADTPSVPDVVDALLAETWQAGEPVGVAGGGAIRRTASWVVLRHLFAVLADDTLHALLRADLRAALRRLAEAAPEAADVITAYLRDPTAVHLDPLPTLPPGAPL